VILHVGMEMNSMCLENLVISDSKTANDDFLRSCQKELGVNLKCLSLA
jgi:hypothetical protein